MPKRKSLTTYPGGKNVSFRNIINQMPPHDIYLEPYLGSGAVLRNKRPAPLFSVGIDLDLEPLLELSRASWETFAERTLNIDPYTAGRMGGEGRPGELIMHIGNALYWVNQYHEYINAHYPTVRVFGYFDPPYLKSTRTEQEPLYQFEFWTEDQHTELLEIIKQLPWQIAISGYESELYSRELQGWREITWKAMTHAGPRTEHLWMNYPEPKELHDTRYVGNGWRDRQNVLRQQKRWEKKLLSMDPVKRQAMMTAIEGAIQTVRSPRQE